MKKLAALTIAALALMAFAAPAQATTATLSVRVNGKTLIVAVGGVRHVCPITKGITFNGSRYARCANGSSFSYQPYATPRTLAASVGMNHAYRCTGPKVVSANQWTCPATVVK